MQLALAESTRKLLEMHPRDFSQHLQDQGIMGFHIVFLGSTADNSTFQSPQGVFQNTPLGTFHVSHPLILPIVEWLVSDLGAAEDFDAHEGIFVSIGEESGTLMVGVFLHLQTGLNKRSYTAEYISIYLRVLWFIEPFVGLEPEEYAIGSMMTWVHRCFYSPWILFLSIKEFDHKNDPSYSSICLTSLDLCLGTISREFFKRWVTIVTWHVP